MLGFFRHYQRYFFLMITIVIIVSFSFFGTYNTIPAENIREQVAFTAINGSTVSQADLNEMTLFLSTDLEDKAAFGGIWGPNFFNDGVIRKDFLQTGLAEIIALQYEPALTADLQQRLEKEKRYTLYSNPNAPFLNIEGVWEYFAPDMKSNYATLKKATKATTEEALLARSRLYLGEKRLPSPMLKQVLRYQEQQNSWVSPDVNLDRLDLSLFGYHTIDDWFGPTFIRLLSEFIMNAAIVAEQKGYSVSKEETWADLVKNAQVSYQQNLQNPHLGVNDLNEYVNEQLRRMNMDQSMAVNTWRQVLLFRRLFQDIGSSVLVDPFSFEQINAYAKESATGDLYQLPRDLQINNFAMLQKFETYLAAIAKKPSTEANVLALPTEFLTADELAKKYPALVQKRYHLDIAQVDKKSLQVKVAVRDSWNWQVEDANWAILKKEFPELATKKAATNQAQTKEAQTTEAQTREERFAIIESLDNKARNKVDAFARNAILTSSPQIVTKALEDAPTKKQMVGIALKGKNATFEGLKENKALIALLDQAPLAGEQMSATDQATSIQSQLDTYTTDGQHYYRIRVLERQPLEILSFAAANNEEILGSIVQSQLEEYYQKNREKNPAAYQKADKTWKPFQEVKATVAEAYYANVLKAIRADYTKAAPAENKQELKTPDQVAPFRLYAFMRKAQETLTTAPEKETELVKIAAKDDSTELTDTSPLNEQWKIEKKDHLVERAKVEKRLNAQEVFILETGLWTPTKALANGEMYFFHKTGMGNKDLSSAIHDKIVQARRLLSDDAQKAYLRLLLKDIKSRGAISFDVEEDTSPEITNEPA